MTLSDTVVNQSFEKKHGGLHYPNFFDPDELLDVTMGIIDTSVNSEINPFTGQDIAGPKRHLISSKDYKDKTTAAKADFIRDELSRLSEELGHVVINPVVTVLVYAPHEKLAPHTDRIRKNPIFTLSGDGYYDTFSNDLDIIKKISRNEYPEERVSETHISPGDAVLSLGNVIHGFRNGDQSRIALGLLESPEI